MNVARYIDGPFMPGADGDFEFWPIIHGSPSTMRKQRDFRGTSMMAATKCIGVFSIVVATMVSIASPHAFAVAVGEMDDFEDGTLQNWQAGGGANPNGPVNVASGGPAGASDNFLRLTSNGNTGAGGRLVVFCLDQWAGDYLGASVSSIEMQVKNLGATNLVLRLILENGNSGETLGTISPVNVPAGSNWTTVSFSLASGNLTGDDYADVMSQVTMLNLVHSPNPITLRSGAPNIAAQLGVDNITAVPEPGLLTLALTATAAVFGVRAVARNRRRLPPDKSL